MNFDKNNHCWLLSSMLICINPSPLSKGFERWFSRWFSDALATRLRRFLGSVQIASYVLVRTVIFLKVMLVLNSHLCIQAHDYNNASCQDLEIKIFEEFFLTCRYLYLWAQRTYYNMHRLLCLTTSRFRTLCQRSNENINTLKLNYVRVIN